MEGIRKGNERGKPAPGRPVRGRHGAAPDGPLRRPRRIRIGSLLLLGAAVLAAILLFGRGGRASRRPLRPQELASSPRNVLLVSLDTVRPDPMQACGGSRVPTPGLNRIRGDGFLFSQMVTPVPITLPAHASLFTAQNPCRHGVRENTEYALPQGRATLAGCFRKSGYLTAAFIASFTLTARFGLAQGFDQFEDRLTGPEPGLGPGSVEVPGAIEANRACRWLGEYGARRRSGAETRPFFLFLHFYDAHAPYRPPSPYAELYKDRPYDGELAFDDQCLGQVLDALEAGGEAGRTLVWVISDHGESLGEHGEATHSLFVYDATLRIVSLLKLPPSDGRFRAGRPRMVIDRQTGLIDLAPTLCRLTGVPMDLPDTDGRSLVPLLEEVKAGGEGDEQPLYCETLSPKVSYHWAPLYGVRTGKWKYIRAPIPELYNLLEDPKEEKNLAPTAGVEIAPWEQALTRFLAPGGDEARRAPSAEEIERLRSLGYLSGQSGTEGKNPDQALPDPKQMVRFFGEQYEKAKDLLYAGRYQEAAAAFQQTLRVDPLNNSIHLFLAGALRQSGRYAEAERSYRTALSIEPHSPRAYFGLAEAFLAEGKPDSAAWAYRQSILLLPESPDTWSRLGWALWQAKKAAAAAEALEKALLLGSEPRSTQGLLARLYREEGLSPAAGREHLARFARLLGVEEEEALRRMPAGPAQFKDSGKPPGGKAGP